MKIIRSSDVGRFLYCPICWWIEEKDGIKISPAMIKGEQSHRHIAENRSFARALHISIMLLTALIFILSLLLVMK